MQLFGQIIWHQSTKTAIQKWMSDGEQPVPEHARLTHYNTRRAAHLLKLSLIACVARSNSMQIMPEDFDMALSWLIEAEGFMPDIFRSMTTTPESRSMEDAQYEIKRLYKKLAGPVPEHYLVAFLKHRTQPQNIVKMIEVMVRAKMIRHQIGKDGNFYYLP